jgi:hypothetical protein
MKARVSFGVWIVVLFCLDAAACFRGLDGNKVRCTNSDHCPSDYICSVGKCVSRFADGGGLDENGSENGMLDSSAIDAEPQAPQLRVDAAPGGDVENESIPAADAVDLSSQATPDLFSGSVPAFSRMV